MSEWKEINFGEIATFRNGLNFKNDSQGKGCKIIGIPDFGDKLIPDYESLGEINPNGVVKKEDYLQIGDIIFVRSNGNKNLVGRSLYISQISKPLVYSGFCIRARINTEQANPLFLAYFFRTTLFRKMISGAAGGANIQNLNQGLLNRSIVPLPSIPTQKHIASILSSYDDLIENNLKRIKLLEELAQRTYEEWFVKFRINGEQLEVGENGLPDGWKKEKLNDLYSIKYGKNLPQTEITEKGRYPVYGASGVMGYYSKLNHSEKVVLVTSRGNGSGDIHRTYEASFVTNNSFAVNPQNGFEHLGLCFTLEFFKKLNLKSYCSGSAQPQLTNASMQNIEATLPKKEMILKFCKIADDLIEKADNLRIQNRLLKESRDILLPRLMSGKIGVGEAEKAQNESLKMVAEPSEEYNKG